MSKFFKKLNYNIIKYSLKINKFINRNSLFQESGCCGLDDIRKKLNCKRLSIQLHKNDDKEQLFKILPLLADSGIEVEIIEFDKILEDKDIKELKGFAPKIKVNFRYMLDANYTGNNVETSYNIKTYSKIIDKIECLTKTAKMNFSQLEEQIMFIINQLSEYISYDDSNQSNKEQYKKKSSLTGALLDRKSVCIGYAMAFERCMNNLNVESKIIQGTVNPGKKMLEKDDGGHAWNIVKINGKWYNVDITALSVYKQIAKLESTEVNKIEEHNLIQKYILSDDKNFTNHYKLEDNGISCKESLKGRFKIYENVRRYKNILEGYDKGRKNNMIQIKLDTNNLSSKERKNELLSIQEILEIMDSRNGEK